MERSALDRRDPLQPVGKAGHWRKHLREFMLHNTRLNRQVKNFAHKFVNMGGCENRMNFAISTLMDLAWVVLVLVWEGLQEKALPVLDESTFGQQGFKKRNKELEKQLNSCRAAWLEEVSSLRDVQRSKVWNNRMQSALNTAMDNCVVYFMPEGALAEEHRPYFKAAVEECVRIALAQGAVPSGRHPHADEESSNEQGHEGQEDENESLPPWEGPEQVERISRSRRLVDKGTDNAALHQELVQALEQKRNLERKVELLLQRLKDLGADQNDFEEDTVGDRASAGWQSHGPLAAYSKEDTLGTRTALDVCLDTISKAIQTGDVCFDTISKAIQTSGRPGDEAIETLSAYTIAKPNVQIGDSVSSKALEEKVAGLQAALEAARGSESVLAKKFEMSLEELRRENNKLKLEIQHKDQDMEHQLALVQLELEQGRAIACQLEVSMETLRKENNKLHLELQHKDSSARAADLGTTTGVNARRRSPRDSCSSFAGASACKEDGLFRSRPQDMTPGRELDEPSAIDQDEDDATTDPDSFFRLFELQSRQHASFAGCRRGKPTREGMSFTEYCENLEAQKDKTDAVQSRKSKNKSMQLIHLLYRESLRQDVDKQTPNPSCPPTTDLATSCHSTQSLSRPRSGRLTPLPIPISAPTEPASVPKCEASGAGRQQLTRTASAGWSVRLARPSSSVPSRRAFLAA